MKSKGTKSKQAVAVRNLSPEPRGTAPSGAIRPEAQKSVDMEGAVCQATGTKNFDVGGRILQQVVNAQVNQRPEPREAMLEGVHFLEEMAPQNVTEAMLAAQMIATNEASLRFLGRATSQDPKSIEVIDANVSRATRLMRLLLQQMEAMQKLKGKAPRQNLVVGHVDVHQGGQAIVGSVNTSQEGRPK